MKGSYVRLQGLGFCLSFLEGTTGSPGNSKGASIPFISVETLRGSNVVVAALTYISLFKFITQRTTLEILREALRSYVKNIELD